MTTTFRRPGELEPLVSRSDSIGTYGQPSDILRTRQRTHLRKSAQRWPPTSLPSSRAHAHCVDVRQSTAATWVPSAPLVSRNDSIGTYGQPSDLLRARHAAHLRSLAQPSPSPSLPGSQRDGGMPSAPLVSRNDSIGTYGQPSDLLKAKQRLRKLELGYSQALSIHQESSPRTLSWDLEAHTAEALHIEEEQMPMTTKGRVRRNESPLPLRRAPSLRKSLSTDVDHARSAL